jgi:hypothetical protein
MTDDALSTLRRKVEQIEQANYQAGYPVPEDSLICLRYPEARALLDAAFPPANRCGWDLCGEPSHRAIPPEQR